MVLYFIDMYTYVVGVKYVSFIFAFFPGLKEILL